MSSVRHVQVGGRWDPPPPASGLDPDACASAQEWQDVLCRLAAEAPYDRRPTLQQVAVRGFRGVSPQLARDLAQLAGVPPDAQPAELSPQQWAALWQAWQGWLAALASGSYAATACPASGAYSLLGAQPQPVPALLPFLAAYYSAEQRADAFAALKQQLVKAVVGAIARLQVRCGLGSARVGWYWRAHGLCRMARCTWHFFPATVQVHMRLAYNCLASNSPHTPAPTPTPTCSPCRRRRRSRCRSRAATATGIRRRRSRRT